MHDRTTTDWRDPFMWITFILATVIGLVSSSFPFFWDTIQLGAMQGDFFYQNQSAGLLLPDRIDSGHIPAFGWYLSLLWRLFGQTLMVSHLAMIPWLWLLAYQLVRLGRSSSPNGQCWYLLPLLCFVDPVILGQAVLVSPDIILLAGFVWAVNSILAKQRTALSIAIVLLGLISLRGVITASCLFLWDVWLNWSPRKKEAAKALLKLTLPYLQGGLLVLLYLLYHFLAKGWIGVHEDSPWAESFASPSIGDLIQQLAILIWRFIDFGRLFVWLGWLIALIWLAQYHYRNAQIAWWKKLLPPKGTLALPRTPLQKALGLSILLLLALGAPAILGQGLNQHRYFLPLFVCLSWMTSWTIASLHRIRWQTWLAALVAIGLFSGSRWIYPHHIAQGWDATPAHIPYYQGRTEALQFLAAEGISLELVGTAFPEVGPQHYRLLNKDFSAMQHRNLATDQYVFYSNIMNDFSDEELALLSLEFEPVFNYSSWGVDVAILQRRQ